MGHEGLRGEPAVHVLPPGWEPPASLPAGMTVAPAADPVTAARVIAERVGGEIVTDPDAVERAVARRLAALRSARVIEEAGEANRLAALIAGTAGDAVDRAPLDAAVAAWRALPCSAAEAAARAAALEAASGEHATASAELRRVRAEALAAPDTGLADLPETVIRATASAVRAARARADAAAAAVGPQPSLAGLELEVDRARLLLSAAVDAVAHLAARPSRVGGTVSVVAGAGLLATGAGAPVALVAAAVGCAAGAVAGRERRRARALARAEAERDACAAALARVEHALAEGRAADAEWRRRAAAASAAAAEADEAEAAWVEIAGDLPPEAVERVVAAAERARARAGALAEARARLARAEAALERAAAAWDDLGIDGDPPAVVASFAETEAAGRAAAERLAALPGDAERERAAARLRELLHGRRLDRLREEAARARVAAADATRALVLCDPFARVGAGRRRALLRDLERAAAADATLAVVTSDAEAIAWAEAKSRATAES